MEDYLEKAFAFIGLHLNEPDMHRYISKLPNSRYHEDRYIPSIIVSNNEPHLFNKIMLWATDGMIKEKEYPFAVLYGDLMAVVFYYSTTRGQDNALIYDYRSSSGTIEEFIDSVLITDEHPIFSFID